MASQPDFEYSLSKNHSTPSHSGVVCDAVISKSGSTVTDMAFSGVPIMIFINIVCMAVIILVFGLLLKFRIFNYYSYGEQDSQREPISNDQAHSNSGNTSIEITDRIHGNSNASNTKPKSLTFFHFIKTTIRLNDTQIQKKCGSSAVQYLRFQRFVFYLLFLITLISIIIILPANLSGNSYQQTMNFGRTTIANLKADSTLIWLHSCTAIIYLVIGINLMKEFKRSTVDSSSVFSQTSLTRSTNVLMISDVPKFPQKEIKIYQKEIKSHLETAYYGCKVKFVQFAFHYNEAIEEYQKILAKEVENEIAGNLNSTSDLNNGDQNLKSLNDNFRLKLDKIADNGKGRLNLMFVKLNTSNYTEKIYRDFNQNLGSPTRSPFFLRLKIDDWSVDKCPLPDDINWNSLQKCCSNLYFIRTIFLNVCLVIIVIFFTTPAIALSQLEQIKFIGWNKIQDFISVQFSWLQNFLPSIMLWTFSQLLPYAISTLSQFEGHLTISGQNRKIMRRTFWFLICMVTIFPSIGLASFDVLLEKYIKNKTADGMTEEAMARFDCIFLPSNGAFFVNYVITSAFIGTGCELLRIPELLLYVIRRISTRSTTERLMLKRDSYFEFHYGLQYAWMLTIVATSIAFSIVCPIITPFGLIYLFFKHYIDKYNLYYAYRPSNLDSQCHKSAINYILFSLYLLFLTVFFFNVLRTDTKDGWLIGIQKSPQALFLLGWFILYLVYQCYGKLKLRDEFSDYQKMSHPDTPAEMVSDNNSVSDDNEFFGLSSEQRTSNNHNNRTQISEGNQNLVINSLNLLSSKSRVPIKYNREHRNNFYIPLDIYVFLQRADQTEQADYRNKLGLAPCEGGVSGSENNVANNENA